MGTAGDASQYVVRGPSCWPARRRASRRRREDQEPRHDRPHPRRVTRRGARESLAPGRHPGGADPRRPRRGRRPTPSGPSELARRLGLPEVVDRQHLRRARRRRARPAGRDRVRARAGGWPSSAAPTSRSVDQVQEFYDVARAAAGRLRGDGPARGPRRARGDLPRPPRRPPAGPAHVGDRAAAAGVLDRDRQGGPRVARPEASSTGGSPASTSLRQPTPRSHATVDSLRADLDGVRGAGLRDRRRGDHGGRRLLRDHDPGAASPARGRARRASRCSRSARRPSACPPCSPTCAAASRAVDPLRRRSGRR